ncbi:MAG: restriction endonuclease subunit S [Lachnospiraceae bacterium]|nr:restriction endonuclease subunit S [Lachnospiraceae bacterium]
MMTAEQLKNSILQLAMQGKLVEQRPEEGTGEELYKEIQAEKKRLINEKRYKNPRTQVSLTESEIPFEIPETWMWCQVGDFFSNASGLSYKKGMLNEKSSEMVRILRGGNIGNEEYFFREDDQFIKKEYVDESLFLKKGYMITPAVTSLNHIGKIGLIEQDYSDVVAGGFVLMLMPYFNNDVVSKFFLYWFDTKEHRDACRGITHKSGQAFYNLSRERLMNLPVPIPPLEEQKRIVSKFEELMPLVEQYAAASTKLNILNSTFLEQMKKSILQEAVRGKLVPQDPNDEPASGLLEKIAKEKKRLIKQGKIKRQKPLQAIAKEEIPFDIPESWEWVRLEGICKSITDGDHQAPPKTLNGIPFLVISNVSSGSIDFSNTRHVSSEYYQALSEDRKAKYGDILFTVTGSYGIPIKVDTDISFCFQRHIALIKPMIDADFLTMLLSTPMIKKQCDVTATGTAQKTVGLGSLRSFLLPIPPIQEQRRILEKLKEILGEMVFV